MPCDCLYFHDFTSLLLPFCQLLDKMLRNRTFLTQSKNHSQNGLTFDYLNLASEPIKPPIEIPAMWLIYQGADPHWQIWKWLGFHSLWQVLIIDNRLPQGVTTLSYRRKVQNCSGSGLATPKWQVLEKSERDFLCSVFHCCVLLNIVSKW